MREKCIDHFLRSARTRCDLNNVTNRIKFNDVSTTQGHNHAP